MVGSSWIRISPSFTAWPSRTWIARTTPFSNGWIVLVWPVGMILPVAEAIMSIWPRNAHASARQNKAMMLIAIVRPTGDGGVSTISSAAGRKANSSLSRPFPSLGKGTALWRSFRDACLNDFMDTRLQPVKLRVVPTRFDEFVVAAVFHQPAAVNSHDAVGPAYS